MREENHTPPLHLIQPPQKLNSLPQRSTGVMRMIRDFGGAGFEGLPPINPQPPKPPLQKTPPSKNQNKTHLPPNSNQLILLKKLEHPTEDTIPVPPQLSKPHTLRIRLQRIHHPRPQTLREV